MPVLQTIEVGPGGNAVIVAFRNLGSPKLIKTTMIPERKNSKNSAHSLSMITLILQYLLTSVMVII